MGVFGLESVGWGGMVEWQWSVEVGALSGHPGLGGANICLVFLSLRL